MINVVFNKIDQKLDQFKKKKPVEYLKLIQWGRKYPDRFIEYILQIELLDHQRYALNSMWIANNVCIVASRASGKSFLLAVYLMARLLLFPNYKVALMAPSGQQAKMLFQKIEDIAKHNLESIKNESDVFFNEVTKSPNSDGFHHGDKYYLELHNGSVLETFNGDPAKNVGYRCHCIVFDEAGKISRQVFSLMNPFINTQAGFVTGNNINLECMPEQLPKQTISISSAEDIDTYLFDTYKANAMKMLEGDPNYFVLDLNCEMSLHPFKNGEPYTPLVSQNEIDDAMTNNEVKALREYFNIFDKNNSEDSVVRRSSIERNYVTYHPEFESTSKDEHYVICYDPAEKLDNSFVLVGRIYHDDECGWMCDIVNGINFLERLPDGTKKILAKPEQVKRFKQLMVGYNGTKFGNHDWDNINIYIDPGSGGGGYAVATYLLDNFTDKYGQNHVGIIDKQDKDLSLEAVKFPQAKDILKLPSAIGHKTEMYAALTDVVEQNVLKFPRPLNIRGEFEFEKEDESGQLICEYVKAQPEEVRAMAELDLMITEVTSIQRIKTPNGNIQIKLPKNLERKLHDDRAYCLALLSYHLFNLRLEERLAKEKQSNAWKNKYNVSYDKRSNKYTNPFGNNENLFANADINKLF